MKNTIKTNNLLLELKKPLIMGIINVTPDSFHKDSRFNSKSEDFLKKAEEMLQNGADIIDIGGYSTRPGADFVSEHEETERILEAIEKLIINFGQICLSIDTFRASVARAAFKYGSFIINDISGGNADPDMFPLIIKQNAPYILTHNRGLPEDMHSETQYSDLVYDVNYEILKKANYLRKNGVTDIIIDPGFGFAKNLDQNYDLLNQINVFQHYNYPVLVGVSRKSMIYKYLNISVEETLPATVQIHFWSIINNASIIRVHDVKEAQQTLLITKKLNKTAF